MTSGSPVAEITGGIVYPREGSRLSKGTVSWPFAKLVVYRDGLELMPRRPFSRLVGPLVIPYEELDHVEVLSAPMIGRLGGTLVFRSRRPEFDQVRFSARRSNVALIAHHLREARVDVVGS